MFRIILRDIKDTWKTLIYLCFQITFIFALFFLYIREVDVMELEATKIERETDVETTSFYKNLWYSAGDIDVEMQQIVLEEFEYLEQLLASNKAYTAFKITLEDIEYPAIVVVGSAWRDVEAENETNTSVIYRGSKIHGKKFEVGESIDFGSHLGMDKLSLDIEIVGELDSQFTLPNITYRETLDKYFLVELTLQDYQYLFANRNDTMFLTNMVMKNASEEEIIEYINKFSYYPYRIIRPQNIELTRESLVAEIEIYQNITVYLIFSFGMSMITLYILLKKVFEKKYKELMVAKIYGSGTVVIFFRLIFLMFLVFSTSLFVSYNLLLKYADINSSYYLLYLSLLFLFSIGYTIIFLRKLRVNDGEV